MSDFAMVDVRFCNGRCQILHALYRAAKSCTYVSPMVPYPCICSNRDRHVFLRRFTLHRFVTPTYSFKLSIKLKKTWTVKAKQSSKAEILWWYSMYFILLSHPHLEKIVSKFQAKLNSVFCQHTICWRMGGVEWTPLDWKYDNIPTILYTF